MAKDKLVVYLAGGIHGLNDEEAHGWRRAVIDGLMLRPIEFRNPMDRDYREVFVQPTDVVEGDLKDIKDSDVVLVNAVRPSWGTAMEIAYAHRYMKTIIIIFPPTSYHPWISYHASLIVPSLYEGIRTLYEMSATFLHKGE